MAPKGSSSRRPAPAPAPAPLPLSFIFIVHELRFNQCDHDDYHNSIPPTNPAEYTNEIASKVMYYYDGNIQEHPSYVWYRDTTQPQTEGNLWYMNPETSQYEYTVHKYHTWAVFACNPLLPILVCPLDPSVYDTRSNWQSLQIFHPRLLSGISQVATEDSDMGNGGGLVRYVAGSNPSWMPALLPTTYRWPYPNPSTPSRGLGGELGIVLGLMALSASPDDYGNNENTNGVFLGNEHHRARWREQRWSGGDRPARGYPASASEDPRGFLITVFLDPSNPQGSTVQSLRSFQWEHAIVYDS